MMQVAVFTRSIALSEIEDDDDINEWLEKQHLGSADVLRVEQSQSSNDEGDILIIPVWYIPRPAEQVWHKSEIPTFEEVMNQCPHCGEKITE